MFFDILFFACFFFIVIVWCGGGDGVLCRAVMVQEEEGERERDREKRNNSTSAHTYPKLEIVVTLVGLFWQISNVMPVRVISFLWMA